MRKTIVMLGVALACAMGPGAQAEFAAPNCQNPGALGVSRVIEIDTTGGPRFGAQYPGNSLLNDGEIVLTFDDGPLRSHTSAVLAALAAHCTKATFFMVGRMAVADPAMAKEVARQGHTVGTHTWSHRNLAHAGPYARAEIELGLSAVRRAVGAPVAPFFRFPYLAHSQAALDYLAARNLAAFSVDVDSFDFRTRDPGTVRRRVLDKLMAARRGIILFHDIQPSTARALHALLNDLKGLGFRVVHLVPKGDALTVASYDDIASQKDLPKSRAAQRSFLAPLTAGKAPDPVPARPNTGEPAQGAQPSSAGSRPRGGSQSGGSWYGPLFDSAPTRGTW
jgi:peptidoglycan-N-acetylglucosamine deacetylase